MSPALNYVNQDGTPLSEEEKEVINKLLHGAMAIIVALSGTRLPSDDNTVASLLLAAVILSEQGTNKPITGVEFDTIYKFKKQMDKVKNRTSN